MPIVSELSDRLDAGLHHVQHGNVKIFFRRRSTPYLIIMKTSEQSGQA